MTTRRSIALFESDPVWRDIFALQQSGHYEPALELLTRYTPTDLPCSLMMGLYGVQLRFLSCQGKPLEEELLGRLREIVVQCRKFSYYDIMIEAWISCYDILVAYRMWSNERLSECVRELVKLEGQMDHHSSRRWLRRKATYLRKSGNLQEALNLLYQLVQASGNTSREDTDNSLCVIYYELGRLQSQMGKFVEAIETYSRAMSIAFAIPNRAAILLRICNLLERINYSQVAETKRIELFQLYGQPMPVACRLCSRPFAPDGKIILPCCRDIVHCECLLMAVERQATPNAQISAARCPSCGDIMEIVDVFHNFQGIRKQIGPMHVADPSPSSAQEEFKPEEQDEELGNQQ